MFHLQHKILLVSHLVKWPCAKLLMCDLLVPIKPSIKTNINFNKYKVYQMKYEKLYMYLHSCHRWIFP